MFSVSCLISSGLSAAGPRPMDYKVPPFKMFEKHESGLIFTLSITILVMYTACEEGLFFPSKGFRGVFVRF